MIKIGDFNTLKVVRKADFGYYLHGGTDNTSDDILLPNNNTLGEKIEIDDMVTTFIYRDSEDRLVATLKKPLAKVGDLAYLEVVAVTQIGAFVNFGLERDLFVPQREQLYRLHEGRKYLFYVYLDMTGRLAATTNVDEKLSYMENPVIGDEVKAVVYGLQTNNTLEVAVDNKYKGIVLKNEYFTFVHIGEELQLRIKRTYEDGRVGLTPRGKKLDEKEVLQEKILDYLKSNGGFMVYNDKSNAEDIRKVFNTSKNYFKMALGGLMKAGLITQDKEGTRLK